MNNFDLYQARISDSRGFAKSSLVNNKIQTFKRALDRSYNSEYVVLNNQRIQALISGIPTSPIITKKNFSTLLDHGCEVGDTLFWEADESYWIVTEHDSTEGAIFQGSIQKCLYELQWQDQKTKRVYSAWVGVKGPEETTITNGVKHSIFFDRLTDSLYLIVPRKAQGSEHLKRYTQIMLGGKKWEIEIIDDITRHELLYIDLKRVPFDRDADTEILANGKNSGDLVGVSNLNFITEIAPNDKVKLNAYLEDTGRIVETSNYQVVCRNCEYKDGFIVFGDKGEAVITITYPDFDYAHQYKIQIGEETIEKELELLGPSLVKTMNTITLIAPEPGVWDFDDDYFEQVKIEETEIQLKVKNKTGDTVVKFKAKDEIYDKTIRVVPLFGGR